MRDLFGTVIASAEISPCGRYRYNLIRQWEAGLARVLFVMLNPSTADALQDDPTIRKCIGFAKRWGYGSIEVVNLFAWRATDPSELPRLEYASPVGHENETWHRVAQARCHRVVAAWGANEFAATQDIKAIKLFGDMDCLAFTAKRHPQHPLYVPYGTQPIPFSRDGFLAPGVAD